MTLTTVALTGMTGQVLFDSHVTILLETTVELVNRLTPGFDGGHPVAAPADDRTVRTTVRDGVNSQGYDVTLRRGTAHDARMIARAGTGAPRGVEDIDSADPATAARRN